MAAGQLRLIRRRIRSIQSTAKITRAMELVAASKMRRAQLNAIAARPYAERLRWVLADLAETLSQIEPQDRHPLLQERSEVKAVELILVTPNRGLSGGLPANLNRRAAQFVLDQGKPTRVIAVGRKGRDFFKRRDVVLRDEYIGLTGSGQVKLTDALEIAQNIIKTFSEDKTIDKVFLVYTEFKTVLSQKPVIEQILPIPRIDAADTGENAAPQAEYIYEQPAAEIFGKLLPKQVETQLYKSMLESVASEQGSRMTAMDSASKNAGELIDTLTLNMNRIRQAAITKEIIEVVSGAAAA